MPPIPAISGEKSSPIAARCCVKAWRTPFNPLRAEAHGRESNPAPIVFLFPGQGSQYVNMARGIYETEPEFRSQVDLCAEFLKPHLGLDLRTVLFRPASSWTRPGSRNRRSL